jgi:hypothetical protein
MKEIKLKLKPIHPFHRNMIEREILRATKASNGWAEEESHSAIWTAGEWTILILGSAFLLYVLEKLGVI